MMSVKHKLKSGKATSSRQTEFFSFGSYMVKKQVVRLNVRSKWVCNLLKTSSFKVLNRLAPAAALQSLIETRDKSSIYFV